MTVRRFVLSKLKLWLARKLIDWTGIPETEQPVGFATRDIHAGEFVWATDVASRGYVRLDPLADP